eukprot:scaffold2482_cov407-Prasinococcus_capsulatus_cf.AAC.9
MAQPSHYAQLCPQLPLRAAASLVSVVEPGALHRHLGTRPAALVHQAEGSLAQPSADRELRLRQLLHGSRQAKRQQCCSTEATSFTAWPLASCGQCPGRKLSIWCAPATQRSHLRQIDRCRLGLRGAAVRSGWAGSFVLPTHCCDHLNSAQAQSAFSAQSQA